MKIIWRKSGQDLWASTWSWELTWLSQLLRFLVEINTKNITNCDQELDKHWRIMTETAIKAKSIKGYSTYNRHHFKEIHIENRSILFKEADREQVEAGLRQAWAGGGLGSEAPCDHPHERGGGGRHHSGPRGREGSGQILLVDNVSGMLSFFRNSALTVRQPTRLIRMMMTFWMLRSQ